MLCEKIIMVGNKGQWWSWARPARTLALLALLIGTLVIEGSNSQRANYDGSSRSFFSDITKQKKSDHVPNFIHCSSYHTSIDEGEPPDTFVVQVKAEDGDPKENGGTITYSIPDEYGSKSAFAIDKNTGVIKTLRVLDRDEPTSEKIFYLNVLATDNGRSGFGSICSFNVTVRDKNDNSPIFEKTNYTELIPQDFPPKTKVMIVSATDIDDGINSVIQYSLVTNNTTEGYFLIDEKSGTITLNKVIDKPVGYLFQLQVKASDSGAESNPNTVGLYIKVINRNRKAPSFLSESPTIIEVKENHPISEPIVELRGESNIEGQPDLFSAFVNGSSEINLNTFRLITNKTKTEIRLSTPLDYEKIKNYTLKIQISNTYKLIAETTVIIFVLDVNDGFPVFKSLKKGSVSENAPPGTPIMKVYATDPDGTEENRRVTYRLDNLNDLFQIDSNSGDLKTLRQFDREVQNSYNLRVIATDGAPSALSNDGKHNETPEDLLIEIIDTNDNPPEFSSSLYTASAILESVNSNAVVIDVEAKDKDFNSTIYYSITGGDSNGIFAISNTTGRITVSKEGALDYEKITNYTLEIRAFDGIYDDTTRVRIFIENVNDEPPVFLNSNINLKIPENKTSDECITIVKAYDPDLPQTSVNQGIKYLIKKNQQSLVEISEAGCLKLKKALDRDPPNGFQNWAISVGAEDTYLAPPRLSNWATINITLIDINDNAPELIEVLSAVWLENQDPNYKIAKLQARDNDSIENGPPFAFSINTDKVDTEIYQKFEIKGDELWARVRFDREEKKSYMIPITITDSGRPQQTGTSTFTVIIGDENDNEMKEGSSSIFVYSFNGKTQAADIGRVYVNDLDDWDLPDKYFYWSGTEHEHFQLNGQSGMIYMNQNTPPGNYFLTFKVTERSIKFFPEHTVEADVNITIKDIPEEAVKKSGSIRFYGITSEEFIEPDKLGISQRDKLQRMLANMLEVKEENVDIFSVMHSPIHKGNKSLLDVRFSAHGSPYRSRTKLDAIASMNSELIANTLGVEIMMINIDECLFEKKYCNDSCRNILNIYETPYPVYTNTSSFVGVQAVVEPRCKCEMQKPISCLNNGKLVDDQCECLAGFDGPHCEVLGIGFNGNGWAMMPSPDQACTKSTIKFNLIARDDGLVFYLGPMNYNKMLGIKDFISLEIQNGIAVLLVDYGTETMRLDQKPKYKLTDGADHMIIIKLNGSLIEFRVDCEDSNCMNLNKFPTSTFLNVHDPIQLGGSFMDFENMSFNYGWNHTPTNKKFSGCIRNFTFHDEVYDFHNPPLSKNIVGCDERTSKAVTFKVDSTFLVAILACIAILLILLLAVVVHRRKRDDLYKDIDDIRENIINYEDEGGGEVDTGYDLNVLRQIYDAPGINSKIPMTMSGRQNKAPDEVPDICGFLDGKKESCDKDPDTNPFDDVRHYAYEGEGNSDGSLSSLASCTDDGDLKFNYLSNFGPRFRKLADMYGEEPSDEDSDEVEERESESWC